MKKLLSIICLFAVLFSFGCAYATKNVSLDSINCEIAIEDSWVIITKDMDSVDILGTPFDIEGMQAYMDSIIQNLNKEPFSNVQAMVYAHINDITYEWQIWLQETDETNEYWDISLNKQDIESLAENEKFVDRYTTLNNDFFFATIEEKNGTDLLMHMTINNGRGIIVSSMVSEEASFETTLTQTHKLLDSLKFTKSPKPVIHSAQEEQTSKKTDFFKVMLDKFMNYFIYNLSWTAVSLFLGGIALLVGGIIYIFKFIRAKVQNSKRNKDRAYVLTVENAYRLKWHKFLIYFSLWISALSAVSQGINFYSGGLYEDSAAAYAYYQGLEKLDTVMGLMYIALGIFIIISRFKLARWRENAVAWLTWSYILPPVCYIVWLFSFSNITGVLEAPDLASWLGNVVGNLVVIIINLIYYRKRKELFTQ